MATTKTTTLIIGGGIQGVHLALHLARRSRHEFEILSPELPLAGWKRALGAQGVTKLRTSGAMHLDPVGSPDALVEYGVREFNQRRDATLPADVDVFNHHADDLVRRAELERRIIDANAVGIEPIITTPKGSRFSVETCDGNTILARNVVIATGLGKPTMEAIGPETGRVLHASQVSVSDDASWRNNDICVIGGGLTAGQLTVNLIELAHARHVTVCMRGRLTVSQLEIDPGWLPGNEHHLKMLAIPNLAARAKSIARARVGHGVTPDIYWRLMRLQEDGRITIHEDTPFSHYRMNGQVVVRANGRDCKADWLICATGYRIEWTALPFCGHPDLRNMDSIAGMPNIDENLQSKTMPGLFFMGRLAELQAGPAGRNIPGARYSAAKIAQAVAGSPDRDDGCRC